MSSVPATREIRAIGRESRAGPPFLNAARAGLRLPAIGRSVTQLVVRTAFTGLTERRLVASASPLLPGTQAARGACYTKRPDRACLRPERQVIANLPLPCVAVSIDIELVSAPPSSK